MVKGVNKTVIEVNNTGSKLFDKIVFYVAPQYGNLSARRLQKAASDFAFHFDESGTYAPLRKKIRRRRIAGWLALAGTVLGIAAVFWLVL